jgi:hypothetical protein
VLVGRLRVKSTGADEDIENTKVRKGKHTVCKRFSATPYEIYPITGPVRHSKILDLWDHLVIGVTMPKQRIVENDKIARGIGDLCIRILSSCPAVEYHEARNRIENCTVS